MNHEVDHHNLFILTVTGFVLTGVMIKTAIQKDFTGMIRSMRTSALFTDCYISQMIWDEWREESLILYILTDILT